jgi:hypothetical protein
MTFENLASAEINGVRTSAVRAAARRFKVPGRMNAGQTKAMTGKIIQNGRTFSWLLESCMMPGFSFKHAGALMRQALKSS